MKQHEPQNEHELAPRVTEALHRRAQDVRTAPLTLDDVKGRAGSIRRRRRGLAVLSAAAVAAVVLPLGLQLDTDTDTAPDPAPAAPTPRADGTFPLGWGDGPVGDRPTVPYAVGRTLITPETEVQLAEAFAMILPWGEGHLAVADGSGSTNGGRLLRLDPAYAEVSDLGAVAPVLVLSPDREQVAWVELAAGGSELVVGSTGNAEELWRAELPQAYGQPVGFLPDGAVAVGVDEGEGYVSAYVRVTPSGTVGPVPGFQLLTGTAPATGLLLGQTAYRDATGEQCSGARDVDGTQLWERCGLELGDVSPDGRLVLGLDYGVEAGSSRFVWVLDAATGEVVVRLSAEKGGDTYVSDPVWEDADTFLAAVDEGRDEAVVRIELDGSVERVSATRTGEGGMSVEHRFVERPRDGS